MSKRVRTTRLWVDISWTLKWMSTMLHLHSPCVTFISESLPFFSFSVFFNQRYSSTHENQSPFISVQVLGKYPMSITVATRGLDLVLLVTVVLCVWIAYRHQTFRERVRKVIFIHTVHPYSPYPETFFYILCVVFCESNLCFSTGFLIHLLTELIDHHMHRDISDANTQTNSEAFKESLGKFYWC